jgi:hypothetical protein
MKKYLSIFFLLLISTKTFSEVDANDIVFKADQKRGLGNISHSFKVTITNSSDTKVEVYHVSFKDLNSSLVDQLEPERAKGRKILLKEYDMWLFTPNIKKPVRISMDQKLTGEVANGDIASTNYANDYSAKILATEKKDNKEVYRLELLAKNKKVTYGRIEYIVEKKDSTPIEATFFALSGKPLKRAEFKDFKMIKGLSRSTKMIIQDYLKKDKTSTMVFSDHTPEKFEDSLFNKDRLEF